MRRLIACAAFAGALLSPIASHAQAGPAGAPAAAATHPDFTGTWVLDTTKSQSPMPLPGTMQVVVAQTGNSMKIDRTASTPNGDMSTTTTFTLDGATSKNTVTQMGMSIDMNTVATWDGAALVAKTTADVGGQSLEQTDRWSLSADGKELTINTDVSAGGQQMSAKLVLNKKQ